MLRLSTRLFAAGTLAALLITVNQGAFASPAKTVKGAKSAKTEAPCCAMCAKKEVKVTKTAVKPASNVAPKAAAAKSAKPVVKTTVDAKLAPKATAKTVAAKSKEAESEPCCSDEEAEK